MTDLPARIEAAFESGDVDAADVEEAIELIDRGEVRVAEPVAPSGEPSGPAFPGPDGAEPPAAWRVNEWAKKAILLYFRVRGMETLRVGPYEYHDKIPLKGGWSDRGVRVVPPATVRRGAYVSPGTVLMPSYVNIGAWIGPRTMVDTWATVGSCAQIGADVHLSGGVGIGGVLEPLQASPVVVEDGAFLGSRAIVVEGVRVGARAVLGANVVITASTPIIDVTGDEPVEHRGEVPPGCVVVPGTRAKTFPAGDFQLPAALIIGRRSPSTDLKTSLNDALRTHAVPV